jgi:PAT family acetyl-CoA transporter-like MFS transporter 1
MQSLLNVSQSDKKSIFLLLVLYTLQGIPMGLSGSVPIILRENGSTYEQLSLFSLVSLPFSLKLLWAPLVDSIYSPSIGRRKSWLIPVQLLSGLIILCGSFHIHDWIGRSQKGSPDTSTLTLFFFILYFLMATQDIAVDGWALTLLSTENVAYGTTCNAIGQTFGYLLSNQGFLVLSDPKWCKKNLDLESPLLDLESFMFFWGIIFIALTGILFLSTSEISPSSPISISTLSRSYYHILDICHLPTIQALLIILFTSKISFGPSDSVTFFKLQEYGMPRSDIALLSPLLLIVSFCLPLYLGPYLTTHPLDLFWKGIGLKLFSSSCLWGLFQTLSFSSPESYPPFPSYFLVFTLVMVFHEISSTLIFTSQMSFFSKIAHPSHSIGGTYMTLLNTIANLGSKWPHFTSLYLLPSLTRSTCQLDINFTPSLPISQTLSVDPSSLDTKINFSGSCEDQLCSEYGGRCHITLDGYSVQQGLALVIGILWLSVFIKKLKKMESLPSLEWVPLGLSEGSPSEKIV